MVTARFRQTSVEERCCSIFFGQASGIHTNKFKLLTPASRVELRNQATLQHVIISANTSHCIMWKWMSPASDGNRLATLCTSLQHLLQFFFCKASIREKCSTLVPQPITNAYIRSFTDIKEFFLTWITSVLYFC